MAEQEIENEEQTKELPEQSSEEKNYDNLYRKSAAPKEEEAGEDQDEEDAGENDDTGQDDGAEDDSGSEGENKSSEGELKGIVDQLTEKEKATRDKYSRTKDSYISRTKQVAKSIELLEDKGLSEDEIAEQLGMKTEEVQNIKEGKEIADAENPVAAKAQRFNANYALTKKVLDRQMGVNTQEYISAFEKAVISDPGLLNEFVEIQEPEDEIAFAIEKGKELKEVFDSLEDPKGSVVTALAKANKKIRELEAQLNSANEEQSEEEEYEEEDYEEDDIQADEQQAKPKKRPKLRNATGSPGSKSEKSYASVYGGR